MAKIGCWILEPVSDAGVYRLLCRKAALELVLLGLLMFPLRAIAKEFGITDAVKKKSGVTYLCSGIGESKDEARMASFPLKVVFATNSGALYSDVTVRVYNEQNESVLESFCDGAWFLVQIPPGRYRVIGVDKIKKAERSCNVTVGSSQVQCTLRWED